MGSWRVADEIHYLALDGDRLWSSSEVVDLTDRPDVIGGQTSISDTVREAYHRAFPQRMGADESGLLIHSSGWRQASDGSIRLVWFVYAGDLDVAGRPGARSTSLRDLARPAPDDARHPDGIDQEEADVVRHAAGHLAFLSTHDPTVARVVGQRPAQLAALRRLQATVAGEVVTRPPQPRLGPHPSPLGAIDDRPSAWRVAADSFTVNLAGRRAGFAADAVDLTEDDALRGRRTLMSTRVLHRFARRFPGQDAADPALVVHSTSWRQAQDGSLRLNWMVLPRQVALGPDAPALDLERLQLAVSDDARTPEAHSIDAAAIVAHGLENLGQAAAADPALRQALLQVPGRLDRLRRLEVTRTTGAPAAAERTVA